MDEVSADFFYPRLPSSLRFSSQLRELRKVSPGFLRKFTDREAMILALGEASRGFQTVSPNPLVGCVILDSQSHLLAFGFHQKFGGPHAEVEALKGLTSEQLQGAQVFVTLEPCAHYGKTPPCALALSQLPVARVIYGLEDPNPQVAGRGAKIIREAGKICEAFQFQDSRDTQDIELKWALEELAEIFLQNFRQQEIFVTLKVATSLDGGFVLKSGESQWITSPESRLLSHELRGAHDATLIGVETLLQDNPSLSVRHPHFEKSNRAVVLDSQGRGLKDLESRQVIKNLEGKNLIWVVHPEAAQRLDRNTLGNVTLVEEDPRQLTQVLKALWKLGLRSLYVEGGGKVISSFLQQKRAHRLCLFQAPVVLGGANSRSWAEAFDISSLEQKLTLQHTLRVPIGPDEFITGVFHEHSGIAK